MTFPPGIRPYRLGDEAAILGASLQALERGELDGVNRHFLETSAERLRHEAGTCAIAEDGGRVAGWVIPHDDNLMVDLPFRRRGHGRRLVAAGRRLAREAGLPGLRLWVPRREGPEAFAAAVGLRYHSSLWQLHLDAAAAVDSPRFPDDVTVRCLEPGRDEPAFVELLNASFADHPSPLSVSLDEVRRVHARRDFDPSTILLAAPAADPARLIGFCRIARYADDDGTAVGEVKLVGVLPPFRGRGLGRALVAWGVATVRGRGAGRVVLAVEGENAGALHLYESLGFRPVVEWPHWAIPVDGDDAGERDRTARSTASTTTAMPRGSTT